MQIVTELGVVVAVSDLFLFYYSSLLDEQSHSFMALLSVSNIDARFQDHNSH